MRCAVVPLMRGQGFPRLGRRVVHELVALSLGKAVRGRRHLAGGRSGLVPALATIIGALDDLAEPAAGLGGIEATRIGRRSLDVEDLPSGEVRAVDAPCLAATVR